jgi:hypothetical protein
MNRTADWLCSKCGKVSNSSEPCYECYRKARGIIPPPPPVLSRPTRDSSRRLYKPPPAPEKPGWSESSKDYIRRPGWLRRLFSQLRG